MAFWEFLLQKDGDRSWLPLESPTVEILEGRYRVVGRSSRTNTPIEIRIAHHALTESAPVHRTQKRSSGTNQDGLVVIMPFTQLQPGDWELYCIGDLMADMMGEGWQYGVKLQVLPVVQDAEAWEPDPHEPADTVVALNSAESQQTLSAVQPAAQLVAQSTAQSAAQSIGHLAIVPDTEAIPLVSPNEQPAVAEATVPEMPPSEAIAAETDAFASSPADLTLADAILPETLPPLTLTLEQEMYVVRRGEPLLLRGELRSIAPDARKLPLQVRVRLFAPQNAQILFDQAYPLSPAALPLPVTCAVPLPHHYETYLMLGEVAVELASANATPLATQSFKVTTDLHELLESIADSFADLPNVLPPLESLSLPTERPGFAQPTVLPTVQFQPAQSVLPPQLRSVSPEGGDVPKERRIELPTFAQEPDAPSTQEAPTSEAPTPEAPTLETVPAADQAAKPFPEAALPEPIASNHAPSADPPVPDFPVAASLPSDRSIIAETFREIGIAERGVAPANAASPPSLKSSEETNSPQLAPSVRLPQSGHEFTDPHSGKPSGQPASKPILAATDPAADWQHADPLKPRKPAPDAPLAPEDIAFRSLNLQQRFLSRLQSLAGDSQLSDSLRSNQTAPTPPGSDADSPTVSVFDDRKAPDPDPRAQQPIGQDAALAYDEFVIDEGWEEMAAMQQRLPLRGTAKQSLWQKPWLSTSAAEPLPGLTLSPDEPLPVPILHLPSENLMSGSSVLVLVKLPDCPAKLAVKLWLIDRQSRLLLDGPHWLTDFAPDGFGQWMSRMELLLPQGYLEVQVEAISVEIMTQRESEKIAEARTIQPPFSQYSYDSIDV